MKTFISIKIRSTISKICICLILGTVTSLVSCEDELPDEGSIADETPPTADFSYASEIGNYATINFTNLSTSSTDYLWQFGDGTSSEEKDPIHTYTQDDTYTVKLVASDKNGLSDTTSMNIEIVEPEDDFVLFILNPSFEDGDANWLNTDLGDPMTVFTSFAQDGSVAARLLVTTQIVYQTIAVQKDKDYSISFYYTVNGSTEAKIQAFILDKHITALADVANSTVVSQDFTDPSGSVTTFSKGVIAFNSGELESVSLLITTEKDCALDNFTIIEN